MKYDDEKEENWESSDFGEAIHRLIDQLETLSASGNTKIKADWIHERLERINHIGFSLWDELQKEKAKPKWIPTKIKKSDLLSSIARTTNEDRD